MAVDIFYDQVSMKECAGRGGRTRGGLHAKRTRFRSSYRARPIAELKFLSNLFVKTCGNGTKLLRPNDL